MTDVQIALRLFTIIFFAILIFGSVCWALLRALERRITEELRSEMSILRSDMRNLRSETREEVSQWVGKIYEQCEKTAHLETLVELHVTANRKAANPDS